MDYQKIVQLPIDQDTFSSIETKLSEGYFINDWLVVGSKLLILYQLPEVPEP